MSCSAIDETSNILSKSYQESLRGKVSSTRYKIAFLGFLGFALTYSMRANISLAIVAMVKEPKAKDASHNKNCPSLSRNKTDDFKSETQMGSFDWTTTEQASLLGGFFYGYLFLQIPCGYLTSLYGGKFFFGFGILFRSILIMLNPPVAYLGVHWLISVKVLEGVVEGAVLPSFHQVAGRWAPKFERSTFNGIQT